MGFGLTSASAAYAGCTTTTHDFNDGTLQGFSQYGSFSLGNSGGAAYYSGNSSGCTLHGMYKDFSGGNSISISYNYSAGSSNYSQVTNSYFSLQDASTGSGLGGEYVSYPRYGIGASSGSYSNSWSTEIAGVAQVRVVMGTYDCWSTNYSQWNSIDNVVVTVCSSDEDGDGVDGIADGGTDCDDSDASIYPGATETCDGVDNNCDGTVDEDSAADASTFYADSDSDGYGDPSSTYTTCYQPSGYVTDATDCDDGDSATYPGAAETCDGHDDGYTSCESDCNDTDPAINVDATEIWYDDIDQNCDGWSDFDQDGDGFDHLDYDGDDCDDENPDIHVDAEEIWYDGIDQDCDTLSDFDADYDGQDSESYGGDDCDDADPDTYDGAPDAPYDGIITDCSNANDYDADGDGVLALEYGRKDCDDANSDVYPGAEEIWYDGIDQDCDGNDDDQDEDGYALDADCDDEDADSYPDNGSLDAECNPIETEDTGSDTGESGSSPDKEGGCFSSTTGRKPVGPWALLIAGLLFLRRRIV